MSSDAVAFKVESVVGGATPSGLVAGDCINVANEEFVTFNFAVNDYNGNIPINDTALTFSAEGFGIDSQPNPIGNRPSTEAVRFPLTIRKDDVPEAGFVRLFATHPVSGDSGSITIGNLTDDPAIQITTTDYLMDVASGSQILEFVFTDACGKPPAASDIIIFEVTEVDQASFSKGDTIATHPVTNVKTSAATPEVRASRFQINANDLTADGAYRIQIAPQDPVSTAAEGKLTVRAINFGAGGLQTSREFKISL
jgi:hypothetical protein